MLTYIGREMINGSAILFIKVRTRATYAMVVALPVLFFVQNFLVVVPTDTVSLYS